MKILITTELYKGTINGVVTSVKNLEKYLTKLGHEVRVLTVSDKHRSYKEGNAYYIRSIPTKIYNDIRVSITLKTPFLKEIIKWKPDVIHSQSEFITFGYAKHIQKKTKAPIIHTFHTLYEQYTSYFPMGNLIFKGFKPWMTNRLKRCASVVAPTAKVEDILKSYGLKTNIDVVPTGIAIEKFRERRSDEEISALKQSLNIRENQKVIMVLCRLGYEKNISELVFGFSRILRESDDYRFVIVGDGPAKKDLMRLASSLNIEKQVIFTGMIDPVNVPLYYQSADLFVSASTSETQGLTFVEALACGLPLVCKQDECLKDLIIEGENGYQYEKIEDLSQLALKTLENSSGDNKLSREISEKYSNENFAKNIEKLYFKYTNR